MDREARIAELKKIIARAKKSLKRSTNYSMNKIDEAIVRRCSEELRELEEGA